MGFVVPDYKLDQALELAHRFLRTLVEHPIPFGESSIPLTVSIGLAVAPDHAVRGPTLIAKAERAQKLAKYKGGNRVVMFDEVMSTGPKELKALERAYIRKKAALRRKPVVGGGEHPQESRP
jgi:predicted signal transduction protein with EAL and GGDEF domain